MKKKANELEFISVINRDGSGTRPVSEEYLKFLNENPLTGSFKLKRLSISEDTYIAFNMNVFVVKLRNEPNLREINTYNMV